MTFEGLQGSRFPSLAVQVQADVALAHARHQGLHLAPGAMQRIVAACESARDRSAARLLADRDARRWLRQGRDGRARFRPDGSPQVRHKELRSWLRKVSDSVPGLHETEFAPPTGTGGPSEDPEDWGDLLRYHRLLGAWSDLMIATEAGRSCAGAEPSVARPGYEVLPRLRSRGPDLDALRRFGVTGEFQPATGHVFLAVTPRDLELRALAAVCRHRLGRSALADLFDHREDPCEYAAAALAGFTPGRSPRCGNGPRRSTGAGCGPRVHCCPPRRRASAWTECARSFASNPAWPR